MKLLKSIFVTSILLMTLKNYGQFTDQINTNRPGQSFGAFSIGKNVYQAEAGLYGIQESHSLLNYKANGFGVDIAARAGLLREQLEFILEGKFQFDQYTQAGLSKNRNGFKELTLGAKYLFYDPYKNYVDKPNIMSWKANNRFKWRQFLPAVAGYVGVNYVLKNDYAVIDDKTVSPKIMLITQNRFNGDLVVVINLIADKITSPAFNYGYVLTITQGINRKWSAFFENKGIKGDYYSDGIFTVGATHLLKDNIQIDAFVSTNLKDTPALLFGGFGLSWRFDKKYKDIDLEGGKDKGVKEDEKLKKGKPIEGMDGLDGRKK
jgi:Putative MetA-pathway of phenol degradation